MLIKENYVSSTHSGYSERIQFEKHLSHFNI